MLGWFGHKALLRIETWGRNMNEIDGIFLDSAMEDGGWSSRPISERKAAGISLVPTPHSHA
jgi:1-acyl-sn-glycerol-3-phosphate acyltransferase